MIHIIFFNLVVASNLRDKQITISMYQCLRKSLIVVGSKVGKVALFSTREKLGNIVRQFD